MTGRLSPFPSDTAAIVHSLPCSHSCGLLDAVEADPGGGRGDGHGSGHAHAEAVVVLPAVPALPDGGAHLQFQGKGPDTVKMSSTPCSALSVMLRLSDRERENQNRKFSILIER